MSSLKYREYTIVPVNNIFTENLNKTTSSNDAAKVLRAIYPHFSVKEYFFVLYLNNSNHIVGYQRLSEGGITSTVADQRLIFKMGFELLACSIIISHNHPSGSLKPSESDIALTEKIKRTGKILDMQLLDHVIMTEDGFYSFADNGLL
jgi:DNA repair protein RadC